VISYWNCKWARKILPRRLTGTSLKFQRKVSVAVKEHVT
jgi:ribosomal protein S18